MKDELKNLGCLAPLYVPVQAAVIIVAPWVCR